MGLDNLIYQRTPVKDDRLTTTLEVKRIEELEINPLFF